MINRRSILQALAGGAIALPTVTRTALGGQEKPALPSLGFSLYGMKTLDLDVALRTCAEIGYAHVELAMNTGYPTEPAVFTKQSRQATAAKLQELRLQLPCLMIHQSLTADDKAHAQALQLIRAASQVARDLVPSQPPFLETVLGGSPAKWDEQKAGMVNRLRDWAKTAAEVHTSIALKAHVSSAVNSPERLLWLIEQVNSPAIHVAYDYSHFALQGIGLEESLRKLLKHIRFIHVKDTHGDAAKFQFLLPGQGSTDYVRYFSLLRDSGYVGPVCVEVSGQVFNKPGYDPIAAARQCYRALSEAMHRAYA